MGEQNATRKFARGLKILNEQLIHHVFNTQVKKEKIKKKGKKYIFIEYNGKQKGMNIAEWNFK